MAIDNQFGKGIGLAAGFDLGAQKPLDSRVAVNTIEERDAHVTENRAYEGMIVFVDATKKNYQLVNGEWVELFLDEQTRLAALEAQLNGEEGTEGNGVLAELRDAIDDVNARLDSNGDIDNRIAQNASDINALEGLVGNPADAEKDATGLHLALDNAKAELNQAIATEKDRAEGVEAAIRQELANEKAALQSEIDADVSAEAGLREAADTKIREDFAAADSALHTTISKEIDDDVAAEAELRVAADNKIREDFAAADAALKTALQKEIDDDVKVVSDALAELIEKVGHEGTNNEFEDPEPATGLVAKVLANEAFVAAQPAIDKAQDDAIAELVDFASAMDEESLGLSNRIKALEEDKPVKQAAIEAAQAAADAAQADVDAVVGRLDVEGGLVDRIEANEANIARLDGAVEVEGSVKKQIKDAVDAINADAEALEARVKANEDDIVEMKAEEAQIRKDFAAADAQVLADAKKYADEEITKLVDSAPDAMNTLNELAQAIKDHGDVYSGYVEQHAQAMADMKKDLQDEIDADVKVVADELDKQKDAEQEGTLAHQIAAENTRALGQEAAIRGEMATEAQRVDKKIADDIAAESALRVAEEQRIEGLVEAEAGRADAEEKRIVGLVEAEKGRAEGKEGELLAAINKEIEDRGTAVTGEKERAEGQEAAIRGELASAISKEVQDRDAAIKVEADRAKAEEADIRADFAQADADLHATIKAEMAAVIQSLSASITEEGMLRIALGGIEGDEVLVIKEQEIPFVTDDEIDAIIAELDAPAAE